MSRSKTKYIIVKVGAIELPIVFPELLVHYDVACGLGYRGKVVGAGFCEVGAETDTPFADYNCFGKSESLNVESRRGVDAEILNKYLRGY